MEKKKTHLEVSLDDQLPKAHCYYSGQSLDPALGHRAFKGSVLALLWM